jgi:hypothetical protein
MIKATLTRENVNKNRRLLATPMVSRGRNTAITMKSKPLMEIARTGVLFWE